MMIGASCLAPVAMETWNNSNQLLSWATAAAVGFGFIGAASTLGALHEEALILWVVFTIYGFGILAAFVLTGRFLYRLIRHRVYKVFITSTISPQGKRSMKVSRWYP